MDNTLSQSTVDQWTVYAKQLAAKGCFAKAMVALERLLQEQLPDPRPIELLLEEMIRLRDAQQGPECNTD